MDYEQTIRFLDELVPREYRMQLEPMQEACRLLGEPQRAYAAVHITGTNGKGSTAAFLAEITKRSGHSVGMSTSPHLTDVRERIRVNGTIIPQDDFVRLVEDIRAQLPEEHFLSFFEFITLLGFVYFREQQVDIAVVETGLGGRLDATNVLEPKVAIITPISIDHQHHLGSTLKAITTEKCGIIKRGVPTVTAVQPDEVMTELRRWCDDMGSPLFVAEPTDITGELGLKGDHQRQNAACAVEAAHLLSDAGFQLGDLTPALKDTQWEGRLETLQEEPTVVIDGAHNLAGAETLARYVRTTIPRDDAVLMLGILDTKDIAGICRTLVPLFREVICVRVPSERSASPKDLAATARAYGSAVHTAEDVESALGEYMPKLKTTDTLVVSGSLRTIGAVRGLLKKSG